LRVWANQVAEAVVRHHGAQFAHSIAGGAEKIDIHRFAMFAGQQRNRRSSGEVSRAFDQRLGVERMQHGHDALWCNRLTIKSRVHAFWWHDRAPIDSES
jgi:hypothetical protein